MAREGRKTSRRGSTMARSPAPETIYRDFEVRAVNHTHFSFANSDCQVAFATWALIKASPTCQYERSAKQNACKN